LSDQKEVAETHGPGPPSISPAIQMPEREMIYLTLTSCQRLLSFFNLPTAVFRPKKKPRPPTSLIGGYCPFKVV
jgi:hypothetical protein